MKMKNIRYMKIKHALYILLMVFTVLPLLLFGCFMISESNRRIDAIIADNLEASSGMQILDIKKTCEERKSRMEILAEYSIVKDVVRESLQSNFDSSAYAYLENLLKEQALHSSYTVSMSIINRDFRIVSSSESFDQNIVSELINIKEEKLDGNFHMLNVYERETDDGRKRMINAIQGIWDEEELLGYLVQEIETSYFDRNRTESGFWENGTLYILDGEGNLITAGTANEDSRTKLVSTAEERESYTKAWNAVDMEKEPSGEIRYTYGGAEYITYYTGVEDTDWTIRVTVNASRYKEVKRPLQLLLLTIIISVSGLLTVLNYVLAKKLTGPISKIAETLKQIQDKQNYALRVDMRWGDEIGFLADKINVLLDYIERENLQEKEHQRFLERKAERDSLTGILNKKAVEEQAQDIVQRAHDEQLDVALGFLDIDDFKHYNTVYGHQRGDHVIQFVASVLQEGVANGITGRVGGDEFLFCIYGNLTVGMVEQQADRIMNRLKKGFLNRDTGECVPVPCSLGIVLTQGKKTNYSSIISTADEAMYHAKENGKNRYHILQMDE